MANENPYAAPDAAVADMDSSLDQPLAERVTRLLAAILDGVIAGFPIAILLAIFLDIEALQDGNPPAFGIALGVLWGIAVLTVNLVLLHRYGQTIAKRLLKIKIVRTDGSRASLRRIVGLRVLVNMLPSLVPFLGNFYFFIDSLFIFRQDHRCIHDHIADTKVVKA